MSKVLFAIAVIIFSLQYYSYAYDGEVHSLLNKKATINSDLNQVLMDQLGMNEGFDTKLKKIMFKEKIVDDVSDWLAYGGEAEDFGSRFSIRKETTTRAFNHFHDPLRDWDDAGLDALINLVYAGNYGRFPVSLILWGLDPGRQDFRQNTTGDWSWDKAREFYFAFLTGRNFSGNQIAYTDAGKKSCFADCLRALGQMMHLVQDASVPLHTRNDVHLFSGTYETYTFDNIDLLLPNLAAVRPGPECLADPRPESAYSNLPPVTGLIDRNQYTGQAIPPVNAAIGLAEYSNANFLTEDTMWQYPHPDLDDTNYSNDVWRNPEPVDAEDGETDNRIYFRKEEGEPVEHLMAAAYWCFRLYMSQSPAVVYAFLLDETCYADYAAKLIPRALGYSAELLDYFFRGRLQIKSDAIVHDNHLYGLELNIKNMTTNRDELSNGQFSLTVRYTPTGGNPDGSDDLFVFVNDMESGILQYDQTATYRFDLPEPIPMENYKSIKCLLAYHGNLGRETAAVIGKYFLPEESNPCLLIEMDNEYLIWDLNKGDLMTLTDGSGEVVDYPLSYSEKNLYLNIYGLRYASGLHAGATINSPSSIIQIASPVINNCRCYDVGDDDCLIPWECNTPGHGDVCDEYGENQYGFTKIQRTMEGWWDDDFRGCVGIHRSYDETRDYSGTCEIQIPDTAETFAFKKTFYYHHQWADINNQSAPPSYGFDTYYGPEDYNETEQTATLTCAGLDPTDPAQKRKFAFFWYQSQHNEHKEWTIYGWSDMALTVNNKYSHYDYFYRSDITPALTQETVPVLSYSFESSIDSSSTSSDYRHNRTYYPVVSGFIDQFAIVLEQPIITYEKEPGDTPREVLRYWASSNLYIQNNARLRDPEDPTSGYIYDWDQLAAVDMDKIFSNFSKTLAEDIAERGTGAGFEISIYTGI